MHGFNAWIAILNRLRTKSLGKLLWGEISIQIACFEVRLAKTEIIPSLVVSFPKSRGKAYFVKFSRMLIVGMLNSNKLFCIYRRRNLVLLYLDWSGVLLLMLSRSTEIIDCAIMFLTLILKWLIRLSKWLDTFPLKSCLSVSSS